MTHAIRSLAGLLRDSLQTLEYRRHSGAAPEEPDYLLLAQHLDQASTTHPQHPTQVPPATQDSHANDNSASREQVLNYLDELVKDYHLPDKLVYAVADAESSVNAAIKRQPNYVMRNGKKVYHRNGNAMVASWHYGLMQINDKTESVKPMRTRKESVLR